MPRDFMKALAVTVCLAAPCEQQAAPQPRFDFDTTPGNLPKTVVPARYALELDLDPARDGFTGRADILIDVRQAVQAVVLHAHNLKATRAELRHDGPTRGLEVAPGPIRQSWALAPSDAMSILPGRYTLRVEANGQVQRAAVVVRQAASP